MVGTGFIDIAAILLVIAVAADVARADVVTIRGAEPPHLPLIFDAGLEGKDPLLQHALFYGRERTCGLWCGLGSGIYVCGGCKVVQGGRDPCVFFRGVGGKLI